jgi:hypothetical protein
VHVDNPVRVQSIPVQISSEDPAIAQVPSVENIPRNQTTAIIPTRAGLFAAESEARSTNIEVTYAGRTLIARMSIVPPSLSGFTIEPDSVAEGETALATLSLSQASLLGDVPVEIIGDDFWDGIQSPQIIPQNSYALQFRIAPRSNPQREIEDKIFARFGATLLSVWLTIQSSTTVGILSGVSVPYRSVRGGVIFFGSVFLERAVPTDTVVGLMAFGAGPPSQNPPHTLPATGLVQVPQSVTIVAGESTAAFMVRTIRPSPPNFSAGAVIAARAGGAPRYVSLTITT